MEGWGRGSISVDTGRSITGLTQIDNHSLTLTVSLTVIGLPDLLRALGEHANAGQGGHAAHGASSTIHIK